MELAVEFDFVVDDVFDVGVEFFRHVLELIPSPVFEDVHGLDFVAFGHGVGAGTVLGQHEVLDCEHYDDDEEEHLGLVVGVGVAGVDQVAHVGHDRDEGEDLEDAQPPVDRVGLRGQDPLLQVDHVVFGSVQSHDPCQEHHRVGKGQRRGEQGSRGEHVDDIHIAQPGRVQLLSVHVAVHPVLLLVEVVD